ncbi:hypothetical protein NML43_27020 [Rhodopseudomonas palustris]|uniref:hypothetical protein n=1 Tax=Rhodopseudomonas palustris TaxID=1076 RepID=UPI0020CE854B|nr:hypothetical protein [Rhodopseudomonas palustris]
MAKTAIRWCPIGSTVLGRSPLLLPPVNLSLAVQANLALLAPTAIVQAAGIQAAHLPAEEIPAHPPTPNRRHQIVSRALGRISSSSQSQAEMVATMGDVTFVELSGRS